MPAKGAISWKMARDRAESAGCTLCYISEIGGRQSHVNSTVPKKKCKALIELNTWSKFLINEVKIIEA